MEKRNIKVVENHGFLVGDMIVAEFPQRRKWWQFWKPKFRSPEQQCYRVTGVAEREITIWQVPVLVLEDASVGARLSRGGGRIGNTQKASPGSASVLPRTARPGNSARIP